MRWRRESVDEWMTRLYDTWVPRFAVVPHACDNRACGTVNWAELMLSRLAGSYSGDTRMWACSSSCAAVIDAS